MLDRDNESQRLGSRPLLHPSHPYWASMRVAKAPTASSMAAKASTSPDGRAAEKSRRLCRSLLRSEMSAYGRTKIAEADLQAGA